MDGSSSIISSFSCNKSQFSKRSTSTMVQKKWSGSNHSQQRRLSVRSGVSTGTDLSADRPPTRDTNTLLARDASILSSSPPDKSNFREKLQTWMVCNDTSPYIAPRPTTSLANQKPQNSFQQDYRQDIDRELSFLMSRPTSTFPAKPKELVEPLDGLMPEERPVSQRKFLVLPAIGNHPTDLFLRRQRSNLETINQLDYCREPLENDVHFFCDYYTPTKGLHSPYNNSNRGTINNSTITHSQHNQRAPSATRYLTRSPNGTTVVKTDTPMPLPPIMKKPERLKLNANLLGELEEENDKLPFSSRLGDSTYRLPYPSRPLSESISDEDLDDFRLMTPDSPSVFSECTVQKNDR